MPALPANVERFLFEVSGCDEELHVIRFKGREALSRLFRVELELAAEDAELDFEQFVGKAGVLTLLEEEEEPRYFHGVVSRFEQWETGIRLTTYHVTLEPKIRYLEHRHNCRIFQHKNVQDIVEKILKEAGISSDEYRFVLQSTPPQREYCVQYRESELNFISRLLEEEGIFYFFEHKEDKHILVMGDSPSAHMPIEGESKIKFHPTYHGQVNDEHVYRFRYAEEVRPGKVSLKDYNFKKPLLDLKGEKPAEKNTELEIYDYPGLFDNPGRGADLSKVRLQERQVKRKIGHGAATCFRFVPGFLYTLEEHPRESFNKKYLLTHLDTNAAQPQVLEEESTDEGSSYENLFKCIPFDVPYRPVMRIPKPVVEGSQTAMVVGPKGEEIYTDEHGRIKVQFHWDREGRMDEKSSCWIRVSQLWAGRGWGAVYLPRIGQEVIVDFLEGDPDRPIITGRVYHGTNRVPYALPAEKTKSTVKSDSSKGGGGFNELRFEDKKSREQIFIHAEKDYDLRVKNDRKEYIGDDHHLMVQDQAKERIKGSKHLTVYGNDNNHVSGNRSLQVLKELHEKIGKRYLNHTGKEIHLKSGKKIVIEAGDDITIKAGGSFIRLNAGGVTIKGSMVKVNSGGCASKAEKAEPTGPAQPKEADNAIPGQRTELPPPPNIREAIALDIQTLAAQRATLQEGSRNGTPFCEDCGKESGSGGGNPAPATPAQPAPRNFFQRGLDNAKKRRAEKQAKGPEAYKIDPKDLLSAGLKKGPVDDETFAKLQIEAKKKLFDDEVLFYGDEDNHLKIGHADATVSHGYSYDALKGEHEISVLKLEGKASVVEGQLKGKALNGLVEGEVKGEALSVAGNFTPLSITHSKDKTEIKSGAGVEANLIKGEASGQINITPKSIYDNTIGSLVSFFNPKSKFAKAPDYLDHGLVLGAKGEAGIGAAAKVEASLKSEKGVHSVSFGAKAGLGPMAGFKLFLGIK